MKAIAFTLSLTLISSVYSIAHEASSHHTQKQDISFPSVSFGNIEGNKLEVLENPQVKKIRDIIERAIHNNKAEDILSLKNNKEFNNTLKMPVFIKLDLLHDKITDDLVESIIKIFPNIKILSLNNCSKITDKALRGLNKSETLIELHLGGTDITDEGIKHLQGLKNLQFLDLEGTKITDTSLPYIKKLTNLHTLYLKSTKVSSKNISDLKELKHLENSSFNE